ncbi:hypothetical protein [Desulfonema magnum]|uniref:Uncharacterized protein n=1 Tax=Desulfonema magnum TaxID=45655 RepID=A0A975BWQ3_9BACT|nr:hypothetical protein [Desulfonema magnum]QTA93083.1 Uncharacterized protein dnm_091800 [Desulfonema magnum]
MEISINLSKHCIETEAKKLYNRCLSQYFRADADLERLEQKIDILKTILEEFDFPRLRSRYPELAGDREAEVFISKNNENQIVIIIDGKETKPLTRKK